MKSCRAFAYPGIYIIGGRSVLVNTVGGYRGGTPLHETSLDTWDLLLNLNARTVFVASSAVILTMLAQGSGKIVNVVARAALAGSRGLAAYSASKCAVVRLTESMSTELKGNAPSSTTSIHQRR